MSDHDAARALRSEARLVVVQAPAGCGKTFQGADYAVETSRNLDRGRLLVLTHTHAARETFGARAASTGGKLEIRTIDSLVMQIAKAYHKTLGLPADVAAWTRSSVGSHELVAERVSSFMTKAEPLRRALADRYPIVVLDEHQDASAAQHTITWGMHGSGSRLRVFGDPMQQIYTGNDEDAFRDARARWNSLVVAADISTKLDTPHRWSAGNPELGEWVLAARDALERGRQLDLSSKLPSSVRVIRADNLGEGFHYRPPRAVVAEMQRALRATGTSLILTHFNKTVPSLYGAIGGAVPIWEGHTREQLDRLATAIARHEGNPDKLCAAAVTFVHGITTGFTKSAFSNRLLQEVASRCAAQARGKPAKLQAMAQLIIKDPNHRGVASMLSELHRLAAHEPAFASVRFQHPREMREAMRLGDHDDVDASLATLAQHRTHHRSDMPKCAISTIHKSKGLEADQVLVAPLDLANFPDDDRPRCLLYVALSRARAALTLVVPTKSPSPLLRLH